MNREDATGAGGFLPAELFDVLAQFDGSRPRGQWVCQRLGQGEQGQVFAVRWRDLRPADNRDDRLVVKLYDPRKSWARGAARDQYDVLTLLQKTVSGAACHGWTIRCPVPLLLCENPLALVMTEVAGIPLSHLLRDRDTVTAELSESLASALAAALHGFWSGGGRVYGELNLDNLLCDLPARSLALIDPGVARPARLCLDEKGQCYPASHDLAYLVYAVSAAAVKSCALRPGSRARQLNMVGRVLRAACERLAPGSERGGLLDEIAAAARLHLGRIRVSWQPAGIWRRFVRRTAARSIAKVLDSLRRAHPQATSTRRLEAQRGGAAAPEASAMPVLRN